MKALIVGDSDDVITNFSQSLESLGYDIISYRWIMKALDNVEEINPQLILISAEDYPRHWKTFIQYVNGLSISQPDIFLFTQEHFGENENRKAKWLGVKAIVSTPDEILLNYNSTENESEIIEQDNTEIFSTEITEENTIDISNIQESEISIEQDSINTIEDNIPEIETSVENNHITEENIAPEQTESLIEEIPIDDNNKITNDVIQTPTDNSCKFIFSDPITNGLVTGKVIEYSNPILKFLPDNKDEYNSIKFGQILNFCTLKFEGKLKTVKAQVQGKNDYLEFCILT